MYLWANCHIILHDHHWMIINVHSATKRACVSVHEWPRTWLTGWNFLLCAQIAEVTVSWSFIWLKMLMLSWRFLVNRVRIFFVLFSFGLIQKRISLLLSLWKMPSWKYYAQRLTRFKKLINENGRLFKITLIKSFIPDGKRTLLVYQSLIRKALNSNLRIYICIVQRKKID